MTPTDSTRWVWCLVLVLFFLWFNAFVLSFVMGFMNLARGIRSGRTGDHPSWDDLPDQRSCWRLPGLYLECSRSAFLSLYPFRSMQLYRLADVPERTEEERIKQIPVFFLPPHRSP